MLVWFGHASFRISGSKRIYIDPFHIRKGDPPADIILITHHHCHHCSSGDIERLLVPSTRIYAPAAAADTLAAAGAQPVIVVPGQRHDAGDGIVLRTLPACHHRRGGTHPPEDEGVGYLVTVGSKTIYHAGDTDMIPEMHGLRCDIALLPVSGGNVMSANEAAEAAARLKPELAIPMHYGSSSGSIADAYRFCTCAVQKGVPVKIMTLP